MYGWAYLKKKARHMNECITYLATICLFWYTYLFGCGCCLLICLFWYYINHLFSCLYCQTNDVFRYKITHEKL